MATGHLWDYTGVLIQPWQAIDDTHTHTHKMPAQANAFTHMLVSHAKLFNNYKYMYNITARPVSFC